MITDNTKEHLVEVAIPGSFSTVDGRITLKSNYYQDTVDALRAKYDQLEIVTEGKPAIRFEDPEVHAELW